MTWIFISIFLQELIQYNLASRQVPADVEFWDSLYIENSDYNKIKYVNKHETVSLSLKNYNDVDSWLVELHMLFLNPKPTVTANIFLKSWCICINFNHLIV